MQGSPLHRAEGKVDPCNFTYAHTLSPEEKIAALAKKIYAAEEVIYSNKARADLEHIKKLGCGTLPVCIAKTQFSLTQDPRVLGKPTPWNMVIGGVKLYAGAGIIIPVLGELSFLPGCLKRRSLKIKLEDDLSVSGPF
jgi:formate--tetrahydrofolate ligase